MQWSKLKTIILLMLVGVNLFLLALVGLRAGQGAYYEDETRQTTIQVLERGGITFVPEELPEDISLPVLALTRNRESEKNVAQALLGTVTQTSESGVRPSYTGPKGTAEFSMNGAFTVTFTDGSWQRQPGQSVSYGRTFTAGQPVRAATVSVGYADGYPRLLSGRGVMTVRGRAAPVLGRVCMDQAVLDVTAIPDVQPGDEVLVFGPGAAPGADTVKTAAEKAGTIGYEIACGIARRVPRVYRQGGGPVFWYDLLRQQKYVWEGPRPPAGTNQPAAHTADQEKEGTES